MSVGGASVSVAFCLTGVCDPSLPCHRHEFGNAAFVSWVGSVLSLVGGAFLNCRRCYGTRSSMSPAMIRQSAAGGAEYV